MRYNSFLHIFPEQCVEYLKKKFRMHSNLTVRELMVILKRIGIKTIKIHNNGKIYDVFYKREINGIQDFEFLNNLHQYRRAKQIRDEWSKEPLIDYTPELSNMQNASDELLRLDGVYYTNESKKIKYISMKKDNKRALYESIMTSVAKEVKKALNETKTVKNTKRKLNESAEEDPYDYLHDDYSRNQVRKLAKEYICDYYDEFPEEAEEEQYLNWGEFENTGYEDLQEAWMDGDNWAAKIADEEFDEYARKHGWSGY